MPSGRQLRVLAVVVFASLLVILYLSSDSRKARSHDFYTSTVQKMKDQAAEEANAGRNHAENLVHKVADEVQPAKPGAEEKNDAGVIQETKKTDGGGAPKETEEEHQVEVELGSILKRSPIIIFSKSYCPYSRKAKNILLERYSIVPAPFVVELDEHPLGPLLQDELGRTTGRRTVPNVMISGKSIGGGDDIVALDAQGELVDKVRTMGGKRIMEAKLRDAA